MNGEERLISLAVMAAGCSGVVDHIQGGYGLQSSMQALGITPGNKITRIAPVFSQGPVTIEINEKQQLVIGFGMASRVMVKATKHTCGG